MGPILQGLLVIPAGPWTLTRDAHERCSTPRARGHGPESNGTIGQHCGPLFTTPSTPGELVDTTDPRTRARAARDLWSTPQPLGPDHVSPGTAGLTHWPSHPSPSHPGELVDPVGPWTGSPVTRESWPQHLYSLSYIYMPFYLQYPLTILS